VSVQFGGGVVAKIVAGFAALLFLLSVGRYSPEATTVISDSSGVMVCRHQTTTTGREDAPIAMTNEAGFQKRHSSPTCLLQCTALAYSVVVSVTLTNFQFLR
jgi:hypothetical protein